MVPLCHHLRADDDIDLAIGDRPDKSLGTGRCCHGIAREHREPGFGKAVQYFFGKPFHPRTAGLHAVFLAAFGTIALRARLIAAIMAFQPAGQPVCHHPAVAIRAGDLVAATAAQRKRRIAPAVQEQQRLLAGLQPLVDGLDQRRGKPGATLRRCAAQIDGADFRKLCQADPFRQRDAAISRRVPRHACIHPAFQRRCRGGENHRAGFEPRPQHRHVTGVIDHLVFLLVGLLMLFIDNDQPEPCKRQEQG